MNLQFHIFFNDKLVESAIFLRTTNLDKTVINVESFDCYTIHMKMKLSTLRRSGTNTAGKTNIFNVCMTNTSCLSVSILFSYVINVSDFEDV